MDKIRRFIDCSFPFDVCNLRCSYCFLAQTGAQFTGKQSCFNYSAGTIERALSKERLGGTAFVNICGAGETLIPKEIVEIVYGILKAGHFVSIVTNGTITERFNEIMLFPKEFLERCAFVFSLHYIELMKTHKLDDFFDNVMKIKNAGCSFSIKLVAYDDYLPLRDEIISACYKRVGAPPHVSLPIDHTQEHSLMTSLKFEEFISSWSDFGSLSFDAEILNYNVKRTNFCYAGDWSLVLDLSSGNAWQCYGVSTNEQNIFENIDNPIKFEAIGHNCIRPYCICALNYLALGIIPKNGMPTYSQVRDRSEAEWFIQE